MKTLQERCDEQNEINNSIYLMKVGFNAGLEAAALFLEQEAHKNNILYKKIKKPDYKKFLSDKVNSFRIAARKVRKIKHRNRG